MVEVKNRRNGKIGYIKNEGEKITIEFEDGTTKDYTQASFKKIFSKTGDVKVVKKENNEITTTQEVLEMEQPQQEEVKEEGVNKEMEQIIAKLDQDVKEIKEVKEVREVETKQEEVKEVKNEKTLVEKIMEIVDDFVKDPKYNNNNTILEYVVRKTRSKVSLNGKTLFKLDTQKRSIEFYFNTRQLEEKDINRMTKIVPDSYGWTMNGMYKVVNESQFDTLKELMANAHEARIRCEKEKEENRVAKQQAREKEKAERKAKRQEEEKIVGETLKLVEEFVDNPNFNNNDTRLEYVVRKTRSKVSLNDRTLFKMDVQKKGIAFYFNTKQLSEEDLALLDKIVPQSYGWTMDGMFKVTSQEQFETLNKLMASAYDQRVAIEKVKAQEIAKIAKEMKEKREEKVEEKSK